MKISERIFEIMDAKNIKQIDLKDKTGINQSTISDWKRKGTNPEAKKLVKIAEALGVDVKELLISPTGELYE